MVIFNSYVSLPEGINRIQQQCLESAAKARGAALHISVAVRRLDASDLLWWCNRSAPAPWDTWNDAIT